jgi:hypothetical protein
MRSRFDEEAALLFTPGSLLKGRARYAKPRKRHRLGDGSRKICRFANACRLN